MAKPKTAKQAPRKSPATPTAGTKNSTTGPVAIVAAQQQKQVAARFALRGALAAALVGTVLSLILNWGRTPVPLVGDWTAFGILAVILGAVFATVAAAYSYVIGLRFRNTQMPPNRRHNYWISVAPVALGTGMQIFLAAGIGIIFASVVFKELALINGIASPIVGAICAVIVFTVMGRFLLVTERSVLLTLALLLFLGIVVAAANEQNPKWWEESFSYLGTAESNTNLFFNISFVLTGLLIVVWQQFYLENITILVERTIVRPRAHTIFKYGIIVVGIFVTLIGILHWGAGPVITTVHDLSAYTAGGLITLAMLAIRWLIPKMSNEFYVATYVMAAVMIGAVLMLLFGIFNTVGVEFVYFTTAGAWFVLLMESTEMLVATTAPATR